MSIKKDQIGNVIEIALDESTFCFGRVIEGGFIEFYDLRLGDKERENISNDLTGFKVIFTLSVHKSWKKKVNWKIIGNNPKNIPGIPLQFIQNVANPNDIKLIDSSGNARPATISELRGIERLSVWEDDHVEERLRDHFSGRQNVWVELQKPKEA